MFDISWGELMLIGVVALIFIGPKELPGVLRMVGQWVGKIRRMAGEFQSQFQEAMREAEMADLKKHVDELNETARSLKTSYDPLKDFDSAVSDSALTGGTSSSATSSSSAATTTPSPGSATPAVTTTEASHASPQTPAPSEPASDVAVSPPEAPAVTEKDFAPAEPSSAAPPDQDGRRA